MIYAHISQPEADLLTANEAGRQDLIGQRIPVYHIDRHEYGEEYITTGSQRVGKDFNGLGAEVIRNREGSSLYVSFGKFTKDSLCHQVGTLIITKVK